jgi:hypothetical protein
MDTDDPFDTIIRRFIMFEILEDELKFRIGIQNLTEFEMVGGVLGRDAIE